MDEIDCPKGSFIIKGGIKIKGVLGIIQIAPISYLFVITKQRLVCEITSLNKARIYEILDTELIKLNREESTVNKEYEEAIIRAMNNGFYYSPDIDLTKLQVSGLDSEEEEWVRTSEKIQVILLSMFNYNFRTLKAKLNHKTQNINTGGTCNYTKIYDTMIYQIPHGKSK